MFRIDKTRFFRAVSIVLWLFFGAIAHASTGDRVALIIGNSQYSSVPSLKNPKNDAADLAETLSKLDFEVQVETDLDHSGLLKALRGFQRQARGAEVALIYYAGHGIEMAKQNYLIPTDAVLETDSDILFEAVPLENAVLAAEGAQTLSLVIVDACRNNPFAAQIQQTNSTRSIGRGLAKLEPQGNTLIAYAAKDGTVALDGDGRNSPYATALISALEEPNLEVGLMFRKVRDMVRETTGYQQEPFFYGSLSSEELFLNTSEEVVVAAVPVVTDAPEVTGDKRDVDLKVVSLIWDSIRQSRDPADFQDFLVSYPESPFAPYAQRALDRVMAAGKVVEQKDPVEIASNMDAAIPPKAVVKAPVTVAVDVPKTLQKQSKIAPAEENTDLAMLAPPTANVTEETVKKQAPDIVPERSLTRDEIREIQERLTIIKYKPGPIDGVMGKRTGQAISAYQKAKQMVDNGTPDLAILAALRSDVSDDDVAAFRVDLAKRRAAWAAAQRKKKAQAAAQAAALAEQQARAAAAAKAAAEAAAKPVRKRNNLEATDGDRSSGSSSSGGGSSGGSSSGSGGGSSCSGIC